MEIGLENARFACREDRYAGRAFFVYVLAWCVGEGTR